jgi:hypothetical protein
MATVSRTEDERRDYLRARFPRVSPTPLPLGQLSGFEEPPGEPMRLFAPGPAALEAFRQVWDGLHLPTWRLELECGHPLPETRPDYMPLSVWCERCGDDVGLQLIESRT